MAAGLHGMASTACHSPGDQDASSSTETLSKHEIALGAALLTPRGPARLRRRRAHRVQ